MALHQRFVGLGWLLSLFGVAMLALSFYPPLSLILHAVILIGIGLSILYLGYFSKNYKSEYIIVTILFVSVSIVSFSFFGLPEAYIPPFKRKLSYFGARDSDNEMRRSINMILYFLPLVYSILLGMVNVLAITPQSYLKKFIQLKDSFES